MRKALARILVGDVREKLATLPDESVHCIITSPPYWGLRDYGVSGQIGLESDFRDYIAIMVEVFRQVKRVLRSDGTCWLNLGDTYKSKELCGIPWRVVFALQENGWHLRQDIIWNKPSTIPESVTDRCTKSHEYLFLLTKSPQYFYDFVAIQETSVSGPSIGRDRSAESYNKCAYPGGDRFSPGAREYGDKRNKRSVWTISTQPFSGAHFAVFPTALVEPCIKAGTSEKGVCSNCGTPWIRYRKRQTMIIARSARTHTLGRTRSSGTVLENNKIETIDWIAACSCKNSEIIPSTVLDPFSGSGTVGLVAGMLHRNSICIELNPEYANMAMNRINRNGGFFWEAGIE